MGDRERYFNLFVLANSITNDDQNKDFFLHVAGKEVKEIYRFLNSDHADEMFTLYQRRI